jgi:Fur family transcriptional regulator, peroxide stress response regulator
MNSNYKKSKQREQLLEILRGTTTHPSADWLYQELKEEFPHLSMGTVYRNLAILVEQGLITKIDFGSTFDRYDANTDEHYHFICKKCGTINDIDLPIGNIVSELTDQLEGYQVTHHRIEFYGLCSKCVS